MKKHLLSCSLLLGLFLTFGAAFASAQITHALQVNVPFSFYAGDAKFPAGEYIIRPLQNSDLTMMEITNAEDTHSALIQVRQSEAKTDPKNTEMVFKDFGGQYFLSRLYDGDNPDGARVVTQSSYEKTLSQGKTEGQERHIRAEHHTGSK